MSKQSVFLVGATGETGRPLLEALLEDGSFEVTCFIRTPSAGKPSVQQLRDRGLKVVTGDLTGPQEDIVTLLRGTDIIVSTIFPLAVAQQIPLIDAAVRAGVKRFLPCNWGTPAARGGIMDLRDLKETVHDHIFRSRLGYTIVDVGYWYSISFPRVPSGKFDYATFVPKNDVYAGGTAPNMLIDKRDVGRIAVKIMKDERTLNKRVYVYGEVLTQNQVNAIIEEKTGEKLQLTPKSAEETVAALAAAREASEGDPSSVAKGYMKVGAEYAVSQFIRADNTPENAEYLGYISGRELYPQFKFIGFAEFVDDLIAGRIDRAYPDVHL